MNVNYLVKKKIYNSMYNTYLEIFMKKHQKNCL